MNLQARVEFLERKLTEADQRIAAAEQHRAACDATGDAIFWKADSQRLREALEQMRKALLGVREDKVDVRLHIGIDDPEPCFCDAVWTAQTPHSPECLFARSVLAESVPQET